jgi:lysophospholipase L1-like esterase
VLLFERFHHFHLMWCDAMRNQATSGDDSDKYENSGPRISIQRRLLYSILPCMMFFAFLETACRIYENLKPQPEDLAFMSSPVSIMQPHPYLAYATNPDYPEHNRLGFREPPDSRTADEGIRVVCIGGSTTYGTRVRAHESYPQILEEILLQKHKQLPISVINAGTAGYASHNILGQLAFKVIPLKPAFVIIDLGHNDVWNHALFPNSSSDNTHAQKVWNSSYTGRRWWRKSAFLDKLAWHLGHPPESPPHIHAVCWNTPAGDPAENLKQSDLTSLKLNFISLLAIARAHNCVPIVCIQPSDFQNHPGDPIIRDGMQQAAEILADLTRKNNVALLDLRPHMNNKPDLFADYLHLNAQGEQTRAELIGELLTSLASWKELTLDAPAP